MAQIQGSSDYWSPLHFLRATGAVETAGPDGNQVIGRLRRLLLDDSHRPLERLRRTHSSHSLDDGSYILSHLESSKTPNTTFTLLPPISIPSPEDKIVQKAVAGLLNAIYEQDFLECSYGFRPGRGPQDAPDEVGRVICRWPISTILEADITGYFGAIVRSFAHRDDQEEGLRWKNPETDWEMDQRRRDRRRQAACHENGDRGR